MGDEARSEAGGRLFARALALHRARRLDEAVAAYRQGLALEPDHADAWCNLAVALQALGRDEEALAAYRAALALRPDLALAHNNVGVLLQRRGDFEAALDSHAAALALRPEHVDTRLNLGSALQRLGRLEDAAARYGEVLGADPDHAAAHANLGMILRAQDRPEAALDHLRAAVAARPDSAEFHNNLGLILQDLGRIDAAAAAFARAVSLSPDFAAAHMSLGAARLLAGDFSGGWRAYEQRLARTDIAQPHRPGPRWRGEDLEGRTVLLQGEQGLGDAIQFSRYAAVLAKRGARVILSCRAPLRRLFATLEGPDRLVVDSEAPGPYDCWSPLLSLPGLVGTTAETVPSPGPYLAADPALAKGWRGRLGGLAGLKLGIVWRGSAQHLNDRNRSIDPALLRPLVDRPGLSTVCLQTDARADELARLGAPALEVGRDLTDLAETAALVASLDLVVTVDTAVAHLAGALGVPVWTLIAFSPDWRWMTGRDDSPWYRSMRLFRQTSRGEWTSVIDAVRTALAPLAAR
jgi:tetratricopeptide (TPR) repeat protein